ncbi:MAG: DUF3501 family protein [Hyphomonadaceae bacterium]
MPAKERRVTAADILPAAQFAKERSALRAAILPRKKLRRVSVGPYATFYFESFDTMLFQIQEMLHIEKGGAEQLEDELRAYNPMIPQGDELCATIMFEIDDEKRRAAVLGSLGGVEDRFFLEIDGERIMSRPEGDVERTREDGKASSVHFVHFDFTPAQKARLRDGRVLAGVDHPNYAHLAVLSDETRAELATDFT